MAISSEVIAWNLLWTLDDVNVTCRKCDARQMESEKEHPFPHSNACLHVSDEQFPWMEFD